MPLSSQELLQKNVFASEIHNNPTLPDQVKDYFNEVIDRLNDKETLNVD